MSMLKDTGERVIPKLMKPTNMMLLEHTARYYFSTPYVKGRVLDIACGSGYGSQMVAKIKKNEIQEIIGADICEDTIAYAKGNHYHPLVTFLKADILDEYLVEKIGTFDTILCFETIEHIENDELFMTNLYNLLNPGGMLILSTPFGEGKGVTCNYPFHVHQFTPQEFEELFVQFPEKEIFFQRGVTIEPPRRNVYYPLGVAVCKKAQ